MHSDQGLISKVGKISADRFKILKERDEILQKSHKKSNFSVRSRKKRKKSLILDIMKSLAQQESQEKNEQLSKFEKESFEKSNNSKFPSSRKILSRETSQEDILSPHHFYSPSYKAQDKHIPTIKFYHSPSESRKKVSKAVKEHYHKPGKKTEIKGKELEHVSSCIPFKKQLPRDSIWIYSNLNDNRFTFTPMPTNKIIAPDFNKQTSRKLFYRLPENFPEYNPKKEATLKKISMNIVFDKFLNREQTSLKNFIPDPYDVKFTCIEPKVKVCRF